jgi:hypothetical protein
MFLFPLFFAADEAPSNAQIKMPDIFAGGLGWCFHSRAI